MKTPSALLSIILLFVTTQASPGAITALDSSTDGNGRFIYTLRPQSTTKYIGGDSNLALQLQSYYVTSLSNPPGWTSTVDTRHRITWWPTNTSVSLIDSPLAFSIQSSISETTTYNRVDGDADYSQGTLAGYIYSTNGAYYHPDTGHNGMSNIFSANIAAIERFTYVGPLVPEPVSFQGIFFTLVWLFRRKQHLCADAAAGLIKKIDGTLYI